MAMKTQLLIPLTLMTFFGATLASAAQEESLPANPEAESTATEEMFRCDMTQEQPRTLVTGMVSQDHPEPLPLINWSAEYFQSENEALFLCQDVSQQLQTFYAAGELTNLSLVSGTVDGEAVVCLEREMGAGCERDRVLFTLDTDQNPKAVLYELIAAEFKPPRTRGDFPTRLDFSFFDWF
jgi:hypothetical protein